LPCRGERRDIRSPGQFSGPATPSREAGTGGEKGALPILGEKETTGETLTKKRKRTALRRLRRK